MQVVFRGLLSGCKLDTRMYLEHMSADNFPVYMIYKRVDTLIIVINTGCSWVKSLNICATLVLAILQQIYALSPDTICGEIKVNAIMLFVYMWIY